MRELVKNKNESMPAQARRLSVLELKSATRETLEVYAASVREFCAWSGLVQRCRGARAGQTSYASHELTVFRVPSGLEMRDYPGKRPPLLSASSGGFDCAGLEHVLSRWLLAAALTLVMFRDTSPAWRDAVPQACDFPCTDASGVQRWGLELQAAKQGEQTIRLVSIESDPCGWRRVFEKLQRRQPQNKRPLRSISFLFRRAVGKKQIKMVPYHGRRSGDSVDRAWDSRALEPAQEGARWRSATSVRRYEKKKRWCQPDLVKRLLYWSGHIASTATASCPQCFFLVTPLRRLVGCFAFSGRPRTDL